MLAIRRGEKEGWLTMDISIDPVGISEKLKKIFVKTQYPSSEQIGEIN